MQINFKTSKVQVRLHEDKSINPGCYGMCLAREIRNELRTMGYKAFAGTEDWGWYIAIKDRRYFQWIGCSNVSEISEDDIGNNKFEVEWRLFVVNECGLVYRLMNRNVVATETKKLVSDLTEIVVRLYGKESIFVTQ